MKPSLEQVREWVVEATKAVSGMPSSTDLDDVFYAKFAELAARWGYEQATPVSTVDFLPHDDYLRFAQRVLEGDAPESDRREAARLICDIRRALYIQRGKQTKVEGS